MVQLRLMLAACAACAACGRGEAAPPMGSAPTSSGLTAPTGWRAAPEIAKAASDAAGSGTAGSEAWAEPARGCYAVWLALRGAAGPIDAAADALVASVQNAGAAISAVEKPAAGARGELRLQLAKPPYHGRLRAELATTGDVAALACVWNEREPAACEAGCSALLGSLR